MKIHVTSWHEVYTTYVYAVILYLSELPACDPNISDNGHVKHENNFWTKKYKLKILAKL